MSTTAMTKTEEKGRTTLIRVSWKNYDILNKLGKTNDTFDSVLTRILEKNNLVKEQDK